ALAHRAAAYAGGADGLTTLSAERSADAVVRCLVMIDARAMGLQIRLSRLPRTQVHRPRRRIRVSKVRATNATRNAGAPVSAGNTTSAKGASGLWLVEAFKRA